MKIREVSVSRVKNLGNYENEKVGMVATLEEGEDAHAATLALEDRVRAALGQPSRVVEEARQVVDKADGLWRTARSNARSYVNAEADAAQGDNEIYKARRLKDAAEWKRDFETSLANAQAEEQRPEVAAARQALGQAPPEPVDLKTLRAEMRAANEGAAEDDGLFDDAGDDTDKAE